VIKLVGQHAAERPSKYSVAIHPRKYAEFSGIYETLDGIAVQVTIPGHAALSPIAPT
jgi:hypothetical protein